MGVAEEIWEILDEEQPLSVRQLEARYKARHKYDRAVYRMALLKLFLNGEIVEEGSSVRFSTAAEKQSALDAAAIAGWTEE